MGSKTSKPKGGVSTVLTPHNSADLDKKEKEKAQTRASAKSAGSAASMLSRNGNGTGRDRPISMRIQEFAKNVFQKKNGATESFRFRPKMPEFVNINSHPSAKNAWNAQRTVSTIDIIRSGTTRHLEDFLHDASTSFEMLSFARKSRKANAKYPSKPPEGGVPSANNLKKMKRNSIDKNEQLSHRDVDNYYFSAINMSKHELKEACLTMLLTTVNVDVFKEEAFSSHLAEKKKSHASMKIEKGKRLRNSLEARDVELREALNDFIDIVSSKYTGTSYHGFHHAVDVTQMMYILMTYYLDSQLTRTEPFFLLVACLCHDIGHMGANNAFLRQEPDSEFITEFGKESSLERFHVKSALDILDSEVLFSEQFMDPSTKAELADLLEYLILATDMEKHQHFMDTFYKDTQDPENIAFLKRKKKSSSSGTFRGFLRRSRTDDEERIPRSFLAMTIKLADIANVSRDFPDAKEWARRLSFEFEAMGVLETTNPMDLILQQKQCEDPDLNDLGKFTLSFMGAFAVPMAQTYEAVSKKASWFLLHEMYSNMQMWLTVSKDAKAMLEGEESDDELSEGG